MDLRKVYSTVRFAALKGALEEAEIMRILVKNYSFPSSSKKFVWGVDLKIIYGTVRFAILKGALEEAEIMQIFIWNYNFIGFAKTLCKLQILE